MKKFIIGFIVVISFAAAFPKKQYLVKSFSNCSNSQEVSDYIRDRISEGWSYKDCEGANCSETRSTWILIMEK